MICPFAQELAVRYMITFEEHFIFQNNSFQQHISKWVRFIDNIFCIWTGHEDFKFSLHHESSKITFLVVEVVVINEQLRTTLYSNPTDRHKALHCSSHHPRSLHDNLPFGQFLRIRHNCSNMIIFFMPIIWYRS